MSIAFVISGPEQRVVKAVQPDPTKYPRMDGGLFHFRSRDLPAFMKAVRNYSILISDWGSEERRAATCLLERLGSWLGKQIVDGCPQPDLFEQPSG